VASVPLTSISTELLSVLKGSWLFTNGAICVDCLYFSFGNFGENCTCFSSISGLPDKRAVRPSHVFSVQQEIPSLSWYVQLSEVLHSTDYQMTWGLVRPEPLKDWSLLDHGV
jgi:hypothetical protein